MDLPSLADVWDGTVAAARRGATAVHGAVGRAPERRLVHTFPGAPPEVLATLSPRVRHVRVGSGEVVVAEGDPADAFYIVIAGEAEVAQRAGDGTVYLSTLGPGDFFGEVGVLQGTPRNATVRAVRRLKLAALDRDALLEVVASSELTAEDLERVMRARIPRRAPRADAVPLPAWSRLARRMLHHPLARHYNRLIAGVLAVNVVLAVAISASSRPADAAEDTLALLAQANIAVAVLFRQQAVINALGRLATQRPTTWPLKVRWALAKYYHHGGLHVGAALAGTAWYVAFVAVLLMNGTAPVPARVAAGLVAVLLLVIVALAAPPARARLHDGFEVTHRFCGWAAIVLVWISTALLHRELHAFVTSPAVWLLAAATAGVVWPWLRLRRVRIAVERPSAHAALVTLLGEPTPDIGTTRGISRHALVGWHQFAIVAALPGGAGARMVVSRAGDWTAAFIEDPPASVWLRGVPTIELANVRRLFRQVVLRHHRQRHRASARAPARPHGAVAPGLGHPQPAGNLRRRARRRDPHRASRRHDLEHRRAGQAGPAAPGLRGVPRLPSRGGHLHLQPHGHLAGRPRARAAWHPGVRSDL